MSDDQWTASEIISQNTMLQNKKMNLSQLFPFYWDGYSCIKMWSLLLIITILNAQSFGMVYQEELNVQELITLFGEEECVEGTLSVSEMGSVDIQPILFTESTVQVNENELLDDTEDKSPMSMLNELAFFNQIKYHYILTEEEGPAHHKLFNVTLHLGEETYSAEGNSIKKAQHNAARQALQSTNYNHPLKRDVAKKINRARKRQNSIQQLEDLINKNWDVSLVYSYQEQSSRTHTNFYYSNMYSNPSLHIVTVRVGNQEYKGEGLTLDIAKQKAATNALLELNTANGFCLLEEKHVNLLDKLLYRDVEDHSPISLIHEFAFNSKQEISFEFIREEGPSHMKVFTSKCRIGERFASYGKGKSKKTAKKEAAVNMIEQLKTHAYDNNIKCSGLKIKNKRKKKQKSKNIIKLVATSKPAEIKLQYSFPDDINPVSKLVQIQQKNNDILPVFTLLESKVETFKGFSIEVRVGNLVNVGSGPNKKEAKRKAAEGMLEILGYSRGSEETRASFSEQKKQEFSNIHVTSSKTPLVSSLHLNSKTKSRFSQGKDSSQMNPPGELETTKKVESKFALNDDFVKTKTKNDPKESNFKTPKLQLEYISQELRFRFQFSDFPKTNNSGFISLLSLSTDPPKVCFGFGLSRVISQDEAATAALKDLCKTHLDAISKILQDSSKDTVFEDSFNIVRKTVKEDIITEF